MAVNASGRPTLLLFFLFFLGLAMTLFAFVDLNWTHRVFVKPAPSAPPATGRR
ncbi:MAG TPA: hypothetical protein VFV49_07990 [Thermoanaerobaculia bacterium]|nr:hypothetical protein [Thermoanaerobaculia bacterium]